MKLNLSFVIRLTLTVVLIFSIFREIGAWTALDFTLVTLRLEVDGIVDKFIIRRLTALNNSAY